MTDVEMTKACAEAMGFKLVYPNDANLPVCIETARGGGLYHPICNDVQAMELVKKFYLHIQRDIGKWRVWYTGTNAHMALKDNLNAAIVEVVAKLKERP